MIRTLSIPSFIASFILVLGVVSCAFEDGDPWGEAHFAVSVVFDESDRADGAGYVTSNDYLVEVESLALDVQEISIAMSSGTVASFDPSSPPDGYSLCHNGHCHHDDGRLVDYEEIAAELAQGAADGTRTVQALNAEVELGTTAIQVPVGDCSSDCQLSRGQLATATLRVSGVRGSFAITDRRTGGRQRLDGGQTDLLVVGSGSYDWTVPIRGAIDGRRPPVLEFDAQLTVPATLFDDVDWAEFDDVDESTPDASGVSRALQDHAGLEVTVERRRF